MSRSKVSAGVLVYRRNPALAFLLVHPGGPFWRNRDDGAWSIPKGLVESGNLLECAKREFNEETGLQAPGPFTPLMPLRQKGGKLVHAFAAEADLSLDAFSSNHFEIEWPPKSGKRQSFPEVDRVAYFGAEAARRKILPGQKAFIDEVMKKLQEAL